MTENKRIQLRRDTSDNWYVSNPVLLEGEIGVDLTNNNIKIGDGSTHWNDLDYVHNDVDLSNYYTIQETNNAIEGAKDALQANIDAKVDNDTYQAKISEMEGNIEGKADQGDTYTKEEVDRLIAGAGAGVSKEYVDGEISRIEGEIPSLSGYATEAWVEEKGYLTEHQSLADYYTKEEIDGKQQATDTAIDTKADKEETANRFTAVDTTLESLHTEIEGKADASALDDKLNKDEFETRIGAVDTAIATKADKEETANRFTAVDTELTGKVEHDEFVQRCEAIEQSVPTNTETWTFELEDGSTITKQIYVK